MGIVRAIGIAVGANFATEEHRQHIQTMMLAAAQKAQAEGVADQTEIRRRMLAARDEAR